MAQRAYLGCDCKFWAHNGAPKKCKHGNPLIEHMCFNDTWCTGRGWYWRDCGPEWGEEDCKRACFDCPARSQGEAEETKT